MSDTITIDPEFRDLVRPLAGEEIAGLTESIKTEGCREPLLTWLGILVDGHHRIQICQENGIPYQTREMQFTDRADVKIWIIKNQFARRNLSAVDRSLLALELEPLLAAKAKERQATHKEGDVYLVQNSAQAEKTRDELAAIAGVSHDTIQKVKKIRDAAPGRIEDIRRDKGTINSVFNEIKKEKDLEDRRVELATKGIAAAQLPDTIKLIAGDFLQDYTQIPAGSVDCIITDPPYVKEWLHNYGDFARVAEAILRPGGFLVSYVGHIHLDKILAQMTPHLDFYWICALKHAGTVRAVHSRSVQCGYKPILIMQKPPRQKPKRYFNDLIIGTGREKGAHEWQQGEEELRAIFEPFTDPGDLILDPFMGSGTVITMAKKMGRRAIGYDINPENVDIVKGRLSDDN